MSDPSEDRRGENGRNEDGRNEDGRSETEAERSDRNFSDLLQELRVTQAGVQILFGFLLTLVFTARFEQIDAFARVVYLVALLAAAGAAAMMIAPVAYHRMLFQRGRKPDLVRSAHRMASGGLTLLLIAMVCAVLLVTDLVVDRPVAICLTAITAGWLLLLWFLLPLIRRHEGDG